MVKTKKRKTDDEPYVSITNLDTGDMWVQRGKKRGNDIGDEDMIEARRGFSGTVPRKTRFTVGEGSKPEKVLRAKFKMPNVDDVLEGL